MKKGVFLFVVLVCFSALFAQTTIVSEGFNGNVTLFTNTGGVFKSGNSGSGDRPASSPFAIEGTHSIGVNNGTLTLTSNTINTTGYTGIELVFRLASFSISSAGNGADATDIVKIEISTDDGTNWTEILQVKGNNNAYWSYSGGTGIASVDYSNFTTSQTFQPSGGGARTADGYSTVKITNLPATNQLKVRITAVNNHNNELWVIDDFKITGTAAATGTTTFVVGNGTEPDTISSLINAERQAVFVFDFTVTDDGSTPTTDNKPTKITSIKIFQGANNQITDWTKAIAGAQLIDNETNIVNGTIETDKISFTLNTATSGKVNDNATKTYELYVWLKSDMTTLKSNIDNKQFDFKISNSSFTVDTTGSGFASGQADITSGANKNKVNVVATKLNIENISNVTVNSPFSANVEATDANGNRDLDNTASVTLSKASGSGNLTSSNNLTQSLVNGYKTFTNLFYDVAGTFSIQADATGLTSATSNNITASISSSNPAVLVENFTATGNLNGYNSWTRFSGGTKDSIQITSGALTYSNYPNSGVGNKITINGSNSEDVYKSFTAITSQYVYYSFLIKVTPSKSSGEYFMFLDPDGKLTGSGDWCARLFAISDGTNIQFGISNSSTASWAPTNYNNTTHCIVVKLDRNTGNLALFVDPDLSNSTEPAPTFTVNDSGAIGNVSSIAIRQALNLPAI